MDTDEQNWLSDEYDRWQDSQEENAVEVDASLMYDEEEHDE